MIWTVEVAFFYIFFGGFERKWYLCIRFLKDMTTFGNTSLLNLLGLRLTESEVRKVCLCYQA